MILTWLLLIHDPQKQRDILGSYRDAFMYNEKPPTGNVLIPHPSKNVPASVIASLVRGHMATLVTVEAYSNEWLCEELLWPTDPYEGCTPLDIQRLEEKAQRMAEDGMLRYCHYANDRLWLVVKEE